jgi:hypothetical protein
MKVLGLSPPYSDCGCLLFLIPLKGGFMIYIYTSIITGRLAIDKYFSPILEIDFQKHSLGASSRMATPKEFT